MSKRRRGTKETACIFEKSPKIFGRECRGGRGADINREEGSLSIWGTVLGKLTINNSTCLEK
jgi:hypothetical protein